MIKADALTWHIPPATCALDAVSFVVNPGEIYVLFGAPGAGKTTMVNVFLGAVAPTGGLATIADVNVTAHPLAARGLAVFTGRGSALYAGMTARQNVEFFARVAGARVTRRAVDNAMRRFGIPERDFDRRAEDLAAGRPIAVWLAVASLREVKALILDEPTAGLDPAASAEVRENVLDIAAGGAALLITSADVILADRAATRVGLLRQGQLIGEHSRPALHHQQLADFLLEYPSSSGHDAAAGGR